MISAVKLRRKELITLGVGSAVVLATIWFGIINYLQHSLEETDGSIAELNAEVKNSRRLAGMAAQFKLDLTNANERLQDLELRMATGDVYRWAIRTIQSFAAADKVDIASMDPPREQGWGVFPTIRYRAATYSMSGTAFYHDFGKFLSDMENSFPHLRLLKLELEPAHFGGAGSEDAEKLAFKMDVMILINGTTAQP